MSPIADLRHDHRHLLSLAVALSAQPTEQADASHLRYRIDSLTRQLADHLIRESEFFARIPVSLAIRVRREEAKAVDALVTGFARTWRTPGAIEADVQGYMRAVTTLRLHLDRLIRREEDCMFDLLSGSAVQPRSHDGPYPPSPEICAALQCIIESLESLRSDLLAGMVDLPVRLAVLHELYKNLFDHESQAMSRCMPVGPMDLPAESARLLHMTQEVADGVAAGRLREAADAAHFISRWLRVHVSECMIQLARYGHQHMPESGSSSTR